MKILDYLPWSVIVVTAVALISTFRGYPLITLIVGVLALILTNDLVGSGW